MQGLGTFLRAKFPRVFRAITMEEIRGARVAIDAQHLVYRVWFRNKADHGRTLADMQGVLKRLAEHELTCTFVFDGDTRGMKDRAHAARKRGREAAKQSLATCERLLDDYVSGRGGLPETSSSPAALPPVAAPAPLAPFVEGAMPAATAPEVDSALAIISRVDALQDKIARKQAQLHAPTRDVFRDVKAAIVAAKGVVVVAEDDAERHAAVMCERGLVDYAVSDDYDTVIFGAPRLLLDFLSEGMRLLDLDILKRELGFATQEQLVDFAILCGCDMCDKVRGVGPNTALDLVHTYKSIDAMVSTVLAPKLRNAPAFEYNMARTRFLARTGVDEPVVDIPAAAPTPTPSSPH